MKKIQIYSFGFFIIFFGGVNLLFASSTKNENTQTRANETTQHPPHDHHLTDHIKKLDEGMRRRRKDEKDITE